MSPLPWLPPQPLPPWLEQPDHFASLLPDVPATFLVPGTAPGAAEVVTAPAALPAAAPFAPLFAGAPTGSARLVGNPAAFCKQAAPDLPLWFVPRL